MFRKVGIAILFIISVFATHFRSIGFVDSLTGWAGNVGPGEFNSTDTTVLYQTTNAGVTWTPMNNFIGPKPRGLCGMNVVNDSVICAVGRVRGPAYFARTTDRGKTREKLFSSSYSYVQGIGFIDEKTGWLGGSSASPSGYQTTDGGETWQPAGFGVRLNRFRFLNDTLGYAVGQRVYKYTANTTGVANREPSLAFDFALNQNYPNPFNPSTTIRFTLAKPSNVKITVYDLRGRKINEILQQALAAGEHAIAWDAMDQEGNPVSAGVYFYKLDAGDFTATRKMILLR
jgi:hypothetical protein